MFTQNVSPQKEVLVPDWVLQQIFIYSTLVLHVTTSRTTIQLLRVPVNSCYNLTYCSNLPRVLEYLQYN